MRLTCGCVSLKVGKVAWLLRLCSLSEGGNINDPPRGQWNVVCCEAGVGVNMLPPVIVEGPGAASPSNDSFLANDSEGRLGPLLGQAWAHGEEGTLLWSRVG